MQSVRILVRNQAGAILADRLPADVHKEKTIQVEGLPPSLQLTAVHNYGSELWLPDGKIERYDHG